MPPFGIVASAKSSHTRSVHMSTIPAVPNRKKTSFSFFFFYFDQNLDLCRCRRDKYHPNTLDASRTVVQGGDSVHGPICYQNSSNKITILVPNPLWQYFTWELNPFSIYLDYQWILAITLTNNYQQIANLPCQVPLSDSTVRNGDIPATRSTIEAIKRRQSGALFILGQIRNAATHFIDIAEASVDGQHSSCESFILGQFFIKLKYLIFLYNLGVISRGFCR